MSFKADLKIDSNTFRVFHCHYGFNQHIDASGHPASAVQGGTIELEVESSGNLFLAIWTVAPDKVADGSIVFYTRDGQQTMKTIAFKNAYMISYAESFSNFGDNPMTERVTITAKEIKVTAGNQVAEHKNLWPEPAKKG